MNRKQGPHAVGMRPAMNAAGHRHVENEIMMMVVEVAE